MIYTTKRQSGLENDMRKYKGNHLTTVICNCCGQSLCVEKEIIKEGVTRLYAEWDYFSEKDGEIHSFDLCETCYDKITAEFVCPVTVEQRTEFV